MVLRLSGRTRRSQVEIMYVILRVCLGGAACKTKIVYDANLNFIRLKRYLNLLLNMGYLVEENDPSKKSLTGQLRLEGYLLRVFHGCNGLQQKTLDLEDWNKKV